MALIDRRYDMKKNFGFTDSYEMMKEELMTETASHIGNGELIDQEERRYPRKKFSTQVEFVNSGKLHKGISVDLSYSGIFVKVSAPSSHAIGNQITMTFLSSNKFPIKCMGRVARINNLGIGVDFSHSEE